MKKAKAMELITRQRTAIEDIKPLNESDKNFKIWRGDTRVVIKAVFGIDSDFYRKFNILSFSHDSYLMPVILDDESSPEPSPQEKRETYLDRLEYCDTIMSAMIMEINTWEDDESDSKNSSPIDTVLNICNRFHKIAQQMKIRRNQRPTIDISDEYDVQYLLHALLIVNFDDIRPEEYTSTSVGSASRMDFLLKKEKIVIEVKKTRIGLSDKEVGDQLIIDIERYTVHPDCETLICFVYDPDKRLSNPAGIEYDLNRKRDNLKVITVIAPK